MKFMLSPTMLAFLNDLEEQAIELNMDVDYETLTLVPIAGYRTLWPEGDRVPEDEGWDEQDY